MNFAMLCNGKSSNRISRVEICDAIVSEGGTFYNAGVYDGTLDACYEAERVEFLPIVASRSNTNPFKELKSIKSVKEQVKKHNIDSVLIYGIKNHPAMAIGAAKGGAKRIVCVVNGTGNLFFMKGIKAKLVKFMSKVMLRKAYKKCHKVVFQNEDDAALMLKMKLVKPEQVVNTNGSGVNLDRYAKTPVPKNNSFAMISRLTRNKGTLDYIEAARIVKEKYPDAKFTLAGRIEFQKDDPGIAEIHKAHEEGIIDYIGMTNNVKGVLDECMCLVHPSYYREGVPRSVLEAMATGRPIITCNTPGNKKTVNGKNGFLVNPKSPTELADRMIYMIEHQDDAVAMGDESRKYANEAFNIYDINKIVLGLFE